MVDLVCTYLLTVHCAPLSSHILIYAILYNGFAFAFQLPIGALGDRFGLHRGLAAFGCLLVALGGLLSSPLPLCILIGLGNACFHAGGGREALKRGRGTSGSVGRFVAPGALGIFLGPRLSSLPSFLFPSILGILAVCLLISRSQGQQAEKQHIYSRASSQIRLFLGMGCMFLTVLLRSYMGTILRYRFLNGFTAAALFSLCIFAGKYTGGILADRFSAIKFSTVTQLLGTLLFVFSVWLPWLALPGIFLFNTSMAITATQLYRAMPQFPGTMFGLTTFSLYLGVLPRLLGWKNIFFNWWGLGLLCLLSAGLLLGGLNLLEGDSACDRNPLVAGSISMGDSSA